MSIYACNLSVVPLRADASHRSEVVTQVFFGETFEIIEEGKDFDKVRLSHDQYEGWIQHQQYGLLHSKQNENHKIVDIQGAKAVSMERAVQLLPGTSIYGNSITIGEETYYITGELRHPSLEDFDKELFKLIGYYRNSPYMWGGRTVLGIDCSGFSQQIYKHFGVSLLRDAYQQAESGTVVDFLPEIEVGDLAFFDNEDGKITHVGVMLDKDTIIHASGSVRVDQMDSNGIYNADLQKYTHKLRIVKRYFELKKEDFENR